MAINIYVENILQNSELVFRKMLSTIVLQSPKDIEIELVRQYTDVDEVLFNAIKAILRDLRNEENIANKLLYKYLDIANNKKRKQLIILGRKLKTKHMRLKQEKERVDIFISNILLSLVALNELREALYNRKKSLKKKKEVNKSNALILKLNNKIDELSTYKTLLEHKYFKLDEIDKVYKHLSRYILKYDRLEIMKPIMTNNFIPLPVRKEKFKWN